MDFRSYQTKAGFGLLASQAKTVDLDAGRMSARCVFATDSLDRGGDVLHVPGIKTDYHRLNPVVLFNHGKEFLLPVGRTQDHDGRYTVEVGEHEATQTTFFFPTLEGEQVFALIEMGAVNCNSIGYRPLKAKRMPAQAGALQRPGLELFEVELLEVSWVVFPMNQDCVRAALSRDLLCGKSLAPPLRQALLPFAKTSKLLVRGEFAMTAEKSDATDTPPEEGQMKHGAKLLKDAHEHVAALMDYCKAEIGVLDNAKVAKALTKAMGHCFKAVGTIADCYKAEYPDHDPLPDVKGLDEEGEGEKADETDEKPAEEKSEKSADAPQEKAQEVAAESAPDAEPPPGKSYPVEAAGDPEFDALPDEEKRELLHKLKLLELKVAHRKRLKQQKTR